ncbi:Sulfite exporter TauE/SafE [Seminavis robusta]|uniref:Sulfite exporter TauE/SafE n=1 Tax=Seminavis robusta TaxID=568900 RepID=A0A9N8E2W2_9STRA|nr:Sulfite exporter TauE/SafE [Seminavis robusta]|eukprot:Sro594_g172470.1 Sulfite exporter TauE/SafE (468) ;mRNA; f:29721-31206
MATSTDPTHHEMDHHMEAVRSNRCIGSAVVENREKESTPWCQELRNFCRRYFLEGQLLDQRATLATQGDKHTFWLKHRKTLAIGFPALIVHAVWWSVMISNNYFYLFVEPSGSLAKPRYLMSITMIFGSLVAGATSEGGGAVAFPVMTLALGIAPPVARDFAFMIQSVGMVASSFTILVMRIQVEWKAILYVTLGGIVGIILGLEEVAPRLTPPYSKMYFVVIWSSFAIGLFLLNRNHHREVHDQIKNWEDGVLWRPPASSILRPYLSLSWKRESLVCFGILGGIFSSMAGSGIDICSFAALTLLFRVSEKVATPTSVVLMAINTTIGFAYRQFGMGGVEEEAWGFFAVCVPIVVIGAPVGAFLGSYAHRLTLAAVIYIIDAAQLIGALVVIQPWSNFHLSVTSLVLFVSGLTFFWLLSWLGLKMLQLPSKKVRGSSQEISQTSINVDDLGGPSNCVDGPENLLIEA